MLSILVLVYVCLSISVSFFSSYLHLYLSLWCVRSSSKAARPSLLIRQAIQANRPSFFVQQQHLLPVLCVALWRLIFWFQLLEFPVQQAVSLVSSAFEFRFSFHHLHCFLLFLVKTEFTFQTTQFTTWDVTRGKIIVKSTWGAGRWYSVPRNYKAL